MPADRVHKPISDQRSGTVEIQGPLAPGEVIAAAAFVRRLLPTRGILRGRFRIEVSGGTGTLRIHFPQPEGDAYLEDGSRNFSTAPAGEVTVTGAGEFHVEVEFFGEDMVLIEYEADTETTITGVWASLLANVK